MVCVLDTQGDTARGYTPPTHRHTHTLNNKWAECDVNGWSFQCLFLWLVDYAGSSAIRPFYLQHPSPPDHTTLTLLRCKGQECESKQERSSLSVRILCLFARSVVTSQGKVTSRCITTQRRWFERRVTVCSTQLLFSPDTCRKGQTQLPRRLKPLGLHLRSCINWHKHSNQTILIY